MRVREIEHISISTIFTNEEVGLRSITSCLDLCHCTAVSDIEKATPVIVQDNGSHPHFAWRLVLLDDQGHPKVRYLLVGKCTEDTTADEAYSQWATTVH